MIMTSDSNAQFRGICRMTDGTKQTYDISHPAVTTAVEAHRVLMTEVENVVAAVVRVPKIPENEQEAA